MNARCVQEDQLGSWLMGHAKDAMAGSLGLFRGYGKLLAQELVEKRRFPYVRRTENADEPGFKWSLIVHEPGMFSYLRDG
jgi:hypothetical protein